MKIKRLYLKSIKPIQTDEPIVAFFFRPFGFILAMLSRFIRITPNMLTVVRALLGLVSGACFAFGSPPEITAGAIMLFIGTFFDVADGQLARITEKFSRMGTIIDGIGDGITVGAVYLGTAIGLFRTAPESGLYWWILTILAVISFLMQLNSYGFLRHEYIFYVLTHTTEKRNTLTEINNEIKNLDNNKNEEEKRSVKKNIILLTILKIFNIGLMELTSRIVLNKKYHGFNNWFKKANNIPAYQKEFFQTNYKKNNGWLLQLFGNLGMGSNLLVFTLAGIFNRLDLGIYTILVGFNIYYLILIFIQQISFRLQIRKLKSL